MTHLIAYHNTEGQGGPYFGPRHGFSTSKRVEEGQTVWVVTYLDPKRRDYVLAGAFRITKITRRRGRFRRHISGPGPVFKKYVPIKGQPWFNRLFKLCQHFRFGVHPVSDPKVIAGLTELFTQQALKEKR